MIEARADAAMKNNTVGANLRVCPNSHVYLNRMLGYQYHASVNQGGHLDLPYTLVPKIIHRNELFSEILVYIR
jgi:hypothetical protein